MSAESTLIDRLKALATHPAARGLVDDAAVLTPPLGRDLVFTHDILVENVHYLPDDPAGDVAWKLLAVNLSDLAAKGAEPIGVLLGFTLTGDAAWDNDFIAGLGRALAHFDVALLGGDTVGTKAAPRVLGLTAIGAVKRNGAPARSGARLGDDLWVTGHIGDAGLGLEIALGKRAGPRPLLKRYRLPMPHTRLGPMLAPHVHAMMDVSDGLLIDSQRIAVASDLGVELMLEQVPLSSEAVALVGDSRSTRLQAATAGDDYELLFAAPTQAHETITMLAYQAKVAVTRIGRLTEGQGVSIYDRKERIQPPASLGWEH